MKKIKLLSLIAIITLAGFTQINAQKMGYLNSLELLASMTETKNADTQLETLQKQLTKQGEDKLKALETKFASVEKRKADGTITGKEYTEKQAEIEKEKNALLKFEQEAEKQLIDKRESLYKPIFEKVNTAIKTIAEENGYVMIFDSSTGVLLHADEGDNLIKLVKAKMGI